MGRLIVDLLELSLLDVAASATTLDTDFCNGLCCYATKSAHPLHRASVWCAQLSLTQVRYFCQLITVTIFTHWQLCIETLPRTLKNKRKGRKKRKGKKKMCREGKRIFSNVLGRIFIENLPQHLKKCVKGKKKRERGRKNGERGREKSRRGPHF